MAGNKNNSKQDIKTNTPLNPDMIFDSVSGDSLNQRFMEEQGNELIAEKELRQQENL